MNNRIIRSLIFGSLLLSICAEAQVYKLGKSTGRLEIIDVNDVTVEGTSGNEIIFTALDFNSGDDERAKGLRAVSGLGLSDNTGIGLSVVENGSTIEVRQLRKMDGPDVKIQVPKGVIVSYQHNSPYADDVAFRNVEGEIEISTLHSGVVLTNVTGPVTVKTVSGEVEADFNAAMKGPVSIAAVHGLIDVTVPAATKATLSMNVSHGEILVDPEIKIEFEKQDQEWVKFGSGKVNGKMNGGGLDISLSSNSGNVYLRKK